MERIRQAGQKSGDRVWELPNFPEYGELLKGKYGACKTLGDRLVVRSPEANFSNIL